MKELIEEYYGISIVGFIKVTENVYKLKTSACNYYLKFSDDCYLRDIVDYIDSIHLPCFVCIIKNKENDILTLFEDRYFYIMEELEHSQGSFKEVKIKFYFELLAFLHSKSCYNIKVNKEYFKKIYQDITCVLNERIQYYNSLMEHCENNYYRSPSQWLFLLNYYRLAESLNKAQEFLKAYMDKVCECNSVRVCLVYQHFDYDHISLKTKKLLSIDKMHIDMPIYDIYDVYQKLPDILFDLDCLSEYYLKSMCFNEDERLLLCCLLNITPIIYFEDDEISNIIKISRLLYYLDSVQSLCCQLDIQKPREFH